jgi:transcriptional regulator with XRE-family HTH domain
MSIQNVAINYRIAKIRKLNSFSQNEFAKKLQVSQGYLSEVENGKKKPSIEILIGISNLFSDSIDSDWLLTGKGEMYREEKETNKSPKWLTNWWQQSDEAHRNWLEIQLTQTPPVTK